MLSCKELTELLTDYLEGRLPLGDRMRFRLHLAMCRRCRTYREQMRTTIGTLGQLPAEEIPPDVRDELLRRFATWKRSAPR